MRVFKYRNLRMFFIPFLGAAVTGRNFNVAGWKKVVVSLMGPVPGILIGGILGGLGLALHNALMIRIGLMAVLINGFNLLPVLPLDGGWIAHAILYSRHHLLDCAFRVFAALGLVALGILTENRFLTYIAIPMLLGISAAYKLARISRELKQRGLPQASPDDQTIPPETALAIINAVRDELPNAQTPKAAAQHTLQVFETLNAKPPGWVASTALLLVHGSALVLSLVFSVLFIVGQRGSLRGFITAAATGPKEMLKAETLAQVKYGEAGKNFEGGRITIVADCARSEAAAQTFSALSSRVPKNGALRVFGKTLLLALRNNDDDLRKQWLSELQHSATNVFVTSTNFVAGVSLSCVAMTDSNAISLYDEAQAYLSARGVHLHLIAPWDETDHRSADEKQSHFIARQTYVKLLRTGSDAYTAAQALALRKKISNATRQGDHVLAKTLSEEERKLSKELQQSAIQKLRDEGSGKVDAKVIDLYASLPENYWTNKQTKLTFREIGARMGQLPLRDSEPSAEAARFSANGSVCTRT